MDDIRVSYYVENEFAYFLPIVEELIVILIVSLDFHDFQEFGDANVVRIIRLKPPAINTTMFHECGKTTMTFNLRENKAHHAAR